jgi:hypothetical protein
MTRIGNWEQNDLNEWLQMFSSFYKMWYILMTNFKCSDDCRNVEYLKANQR